MLAEVGMDKLVPDLKAHFQSDVLSTIATLQSSEPNEHTVPPDGPSTSIDEAGEALLRCMENLSKHSFIWYHDHAAFRCSSCMHGVLYQVVFVHVCITSVHSLCTDCHILQEQPIV